MRARNVALKTNPSMAPMMARSFKDEGAAGDFTATVGIDSKSGSRTPGGANRARRIRPGMPKIIETQKKVVHPIASTINPVRGPARIRDNPKRLEKSAYCVAENLF